MGDAIWLFYALPAWYFEAVLNPFAAGILTLIPAAGGLCLLLGIVIGIRRKKPCLFWFLSSLIVSQAFTALSGFYRGHFSDNIFWPILAFAILQLLAIALSMRASITALVPALLITVFCISYALYAWFVTAMSLTDTWI